MAAFAGCKALTSVTIPNSVTSIQPNAFGGCSSLTSVISQNPTPPQIYKTSFDNTAYQHATLYVPMGSKTAYWLSWDMFDNIEELDMSAVRPVIDNHSSNVIKGIFTLKGERITEIYDEIKVLHKGIYIVNGKKYVIK